MGRGGRGTHDVVHDATQIEIVPVGEGVHESGVFGGRGPHVAPEWRTGLGGASSSALAALAHVPGGVVVGVPARWTCEIDVVEVLAVEQGCSGPFLFSFERECA
jgi:hypothetical protein